MTTKQMIEIVSKCKFPDYTFNVWEDSRGSIYLQGSYNEPDTTNGMSSVQKTRRWLLSPKMTKSEIVQTCFKCLMTSQEHKAREWFTLDGRAIFGPHFDVDKLWEMCGAVFQDEREEGSLVGTNV